MPISPSEDLLPGVEFHLPFADYQQRPGINQSLLRRLLQGRPVDSEPPIHSLALEAGNAGHCLLLEPERFLEQYVRAPEGLRPRRERGKALWAEESQKHPGKTLLRTNLWDALMRLRDSVQADSRIREVLESSRTEVSLFWEHQGQACKGRPDGWNRETHELFDLKIVGHIPGSWTSWAAQRDLDLQASWYAEGLRQISGRAPRCFVLLVERFHPHRLLWQPWDPTQLDAGREKVKSALALWEKIP